MSDPTCTCGRGEDAHDHWRPGATGECQVEGCPCGGWDEEEQDEPE